MIDEEKAIGDKKAAGAEGISKEEASNFVVTGPGLGDLLTEGNQQAVFDLEKMPGPLEIRLERIELLLEQMASGEMNHLAPRESGSTFVEGSRRTRGFRGDTVSFADDAPVAEHALENGRPVVDGHEHQAGHAPFQTAVAGAGNRPHVDVARQ
jgi:hypothetical protein